VVYHRSILFKVSGYLVCVYICVLCFMFASQLARHSHWPVNNVIIHGDFVHVNPQALKHLLMAELEGSFFTFSVRDAQSIVESFPWVKSALFKRQSFNTLIIDVIERHALAQWHQGQLIDQDGVLFDPGITLDGLPILQGSDELDVPKLQQMLLHLLSIKHSSLPPIEKIVVDERGAWSFILSNDIQVFVGQQDIEHRLARLMQAYPYLLAQASSKIGSIDLRYPHGVAVSYVLSSKKRVI